VNFLFFKFIYFMLHKGSAMKALLVVLVIIQSSIYFHDGDVGLGLISAMYSCSDESSESCLRGGIWPLDYSV